jgi:VanZ family protein
MSYAPYLLNISHWSLLLVDKFVMRSSASRARSRLLGATALMIVLGAIALACTDVAGRWSVNAFDGLFRRFLASSDNGYRTLRFVAEKSVHVALFAGLALVLWRCFGHMRHRTMYTVLAGFTVGCSSELFQRMFPTRDPSIRDVLINWSAVLISVSASHSVQAFARFFDSRSTETEFAGASPTTDLIAFGLHVQSHVVNFGLARDSGPKLAASPQARGQRNWALRTACREAASRPDEAMGGW